MYYNKKVKKQQDISTTEYSPLSFFSKVSRLSYVVLQLMFLRLTPPSRPSCLCPLQYSKHLFVHIGQTNPSYSDPLLEAVDIRQIYDKFPEKKGGLKDLYEKGPQNAFFLVKFWVSFRRSSTSYSLLCAFVFLCLCYAYYQNMENCEMYLCTTF